jgi:hypothetical protein
MNTLFRRTVLTALSVAVSLEIGVAAIGAANAAEIHDIGSADNPTYALVLDPQETQDYTGHSYTSSGLTGASEQGATMCRNAHMNAPALWGHPLDSLTCADTLVYCANGLSMRDHTGEALALEWRPYDATRPFRCLTWKYQADPEDLVRAVTAAAEQQTALLLQAAAIAGGRG